MRYELIIAQWLLMLVGWGTEGVPAFVAFAGALAIGLYGVARMIRMYFWPDVMEETMDKIYAMADKGPLHPNRETFRIATEHHGWNRRRFDRWAKGKAWR